MRLDEAIKHCEEVAYKNECKMTSDDGYTDISMKQCAKEHRQLAEWLKELKQLREQTRWIHVSERMPTKEEYIANNGLFIVSDGNRTYTKYFDVYDSMMFGEPSIHGFQADRCIIVWMPLPKSYKVESEDTE